MPKIVAGARSLALAASAILPFTSISASETVTGGVNAGGQAPKQKSSMVVTAPIAAVTAKAGTPIPVVIDRGITLASPPGTQFTGRTSAAVRINGITIIVVDTPVRGHTSGLLEGGIQFPKGAPDLTARLTGIYLDGKWENLSAVPAATQESSKTTGKSEPAYESIAEDPIGKRASDPPGNIVLSGKALSIPDGSGLIFQLTKPYFRILTIDPSAFQ